MGPVEARPPPGPPLLSSPPQIPCGLIPESIKAPDVQDGLRKGRGSRNQIANIRWVIEKPREFQKNICFIDYAKAFEYVDHNKLWKIL